MRFKTKAAAALAALTLCGTAALAGSGATWAATPSCGNGLPCVNIFSHKFDQYPTPRFVADVFQRGAKVGQPVILFPASNADPAEDFTLSFQGNVSDLYAAGLVSAATELHYGGAKYLTPGVPAIGPDEQAFELEYSPYGVGTGLCIGVPRTALQGERVSLQPCGVTAKTVWIWDTFDQCAPWLSLLPGGPPTCRTPNLNGGTFPAINGSNTNFSHPFVLTYPASGYPTDRPRPVLQVTNLTGFSNGNGPVVGQVVDGQLFGGTPGQLS